MPRWPLLPLLPPLPPPPLRSPLSSPRHRASSTPGGQAPASSGPPPLRSSRWCLGATEEEGEKASSGSPKPETSQAWALSFLLEALSFLLVLDILTFFRVFCGFITLFLGFIPATVVGFTRVKTRGGKNSLALKSSRRQFFFVLSRRTRAVGRGVEALFFFLSKKLRCSRPLFATSSPSSS